MIPCAGVALALTCLPARAATITKADNTNALGQAASWVGGVAPGSGDVASWSGTYAASPSGAAGLTNSLRTVNSGTALSWQGISVGTLSGTALTTNTIYWGTGTPAFGAETNISAATQSGNIVTITTKANHGYGPGQTVTIAGVTPSGYNGTFTVLGVLSATQFTCSNSTSGLTAGTAFGTVESAVYIGGAGTTVANSSYTIGSAGIDMSAASHSVALVATGFAFNGSQTWSLAAGRNLRFAQGGVQSANAKLVASGADGTIDISGMGIVDANQGGGTGMADAGGFTGFTGKWRVNSGATLRGLRNGATAWGANAGADSITLNGGTLAVGGIQGAVGNWTWTNQITLASGTTSYLDDQMIAGTGRYLKLNGAIHGSGNLVFKDTSPAGVFTNPDQGYIITAANDLSGTVTIGGPTENGIASRLTYVRVGGVGVDSVSANAGTSGDLGTASIVNNGVLTLARSDSIIVSNSISGTGSVRIGGNVGLVQSEIVTFEGAKTYSGDTTIGLGALVLGASGSIPNSSRIIISNTSYLDVTAQTGGWTLNSGQALMSYGGGVNGNVIAAGGSTIVPGASNNIAVLPITGNLSLSGGGVIVLDANGSGNDQISVIGDLTPSGTTTIQIVPPGTGLAAGTYTLVTLTGALNGSPANFNVTGLAAGGRPQTFSLVYDTSVPGAFAINLVVVGEPASLVWRGDGTINNWDTQATANWINGVTADMFFPGDFVTFDDSGSNTPAIKLVGGLKAGAVTVNASQNYTFAGTGKLTGGGALTNSGSGTLTLSVSNDFTGKTAITAGTIAITNQTALGVNPATFTADQLALDGGTLRALSSLTLDNTNRGITVGLSGGTLATPVGVAVSNRNALAGSGTLTKSEEGSMTLGGASPAYTGYFTVAGGSARLAAPYGAGGSGFFGGRIAIQSGTFDVNGMTNYANANTPLEPTWLAASGSLLRLGGGPANSTATLIDSGTNGFGTYLGGIQYDPANDPGMATVAALWKENGQSITYVNQVDVGDSLNTAIELDFTGGMSRVDLLEGKQTTIEKIGPGTMRISCVNAFPGLRITDGKVIVNHIQALGAQHTWTNFLNNPNVVTVNGGTLDLNGFSNQIGGLAGTGGTVLNNGATPSVLNVGINDTNVVNSDYAGVIDNGTGGLSLVKRGAGTLSLSGLNTYTGATTVSNGVLRIDGQVGPGAVTVSGGALGGMGTVIASVAVQAGATLEPAAGTNMPVTLTVGNGLTLVAGSFSVMNVDKTSGTNDQVVLTAGTLNYGGTLVVSNQPGTYVLGDSFKLFTAPASSGSFASVVGSPGTGLGWSFNAANGVVTVVAGIPTAPTNLTAVVSGSNLEVSWPSEYTGWQLQVQTNAITVGVSNNWSAWAGSTETNRVFVPIIPSNPSVFLRMVYPAQP